MNEVSIYTLTIDDESLETMAFGTEQECFDHLRNNYGESWEESYVETTGLYPQREATDSEILDHALSGAVIYIDEHIVKLPA